MGTVCCHRHRHRPLGVGFVPKLGGAFILLMTSAILFLVSAERGTAAATAAPGGTGWEAPTPTGGYLHTLLASAALARTGPLLVLSDRAVVARYGAGPTVRGSIGAVVVPAYLESVLAWSEGRGATSAGGVGMAVAMAVGRVANALWLSRHLRLVLREFLGPSLLLGGRRYSDRSEPQHVGAVLRNAFVWVSTGLAGLTTLGFDAVECCPPGTVRALERLVLHGVQWACYFVFGYALHVLNKNAEAEEMGGSIHPRVVKEISRDEALSTVRTVLF